MGLLSELPNIGKVVEGQLNAVGITTPEQLRDIGTEEAWLKIQSIDKTACINRLLALEGAIRGIKKPDIPIKRRAELREFYDAHKL